MSESIEKRKIQRPRKRIYEMYEDEAPITETLQETAVVTAAADTPATVVETESPDSVIAEVSVRSTNHPPAETDRHEDIYKILREYEPDSEYLQQPPVEPCQQLPEEENKAQDDLFQRAMAAVYTYSAVSAATGLIPVPLVDMAGFMATQLLMLRKLSGIYNIPFDSQRSKSAIAILASGINSAYLAASSSKLIPFIGAFSMAAMPAVNGALSYAVGRVFIQHFASGGTFLDFNPDKVRGYFEEQYRAGQLNRSGK